MLGKLNRQIKEEIRQMVWNGLGFVFSQAFGYSFYYEKQLHEGITRKGEQLAIELGKALRKKVVMEVRTCLRQEETEEMESLQHSIKAMQNYINSEAFLDAVINRIQRKQL